MGLIICGIPLAVLAGPAAAADGETIVVEAQPRAFAMPVVSDAALARMRGGLLLPNGMNIAIGIDIQTRVDGLLALHTVYATDGPDAGVRVFTDGAGGPRLAPGTVMVQVGVGSTAPSVTVNRSPTGTTIDLSTPNMPATLNILSGISSTWLTAAGQTSVPVTENGPSVATEAGDIALTTDARGAVVTLTAPMLEIQQLVGQAVGVVVANSANNRVIDTVSSINIDLQGIVPVLATGLALADHLALDIAIGR